ncbi:hypothetical protein P170DRAFT_453189 [Aspergillus steynii IBT 23096]|uniref:Zn(2)-C6 fungal-type domain-containing protein n=1 Tax=Aspergillus steynii IBT 23096 TaxID=1392250 RepID=A0A2I2GF07_9EURO|nr:uncharacterized protein P170DRAFT_453189 [Aspergillus steynii IBT 23096]PLB51469.1 hypothetical protein P170DRAFT_453189 [Aspergillus steynii IBT 23096]
MNIPTSSGSPSVPRTRKRAKQACETCKQRKRKCDGQNPCGFCVRYEYYCAFDSQPRKRTASASTRPASRTETPRSTEERPKETLDDYGDGQQEMEATSGTAFPHVLGMKLNPRDAPGVYGVSWNLGLRDKPTRSFTNVTTLLTKDDMESYARVYLNLIHPIYAILNGNDLLAAIPSRWQNADQIGGYDAVLCSVAALGSLYSGSSSIHSREAELVECAKEILEATSSVNRPSLHHLTAWILRTLYLRTTNSPHTSWMASSTAMHVAEAIGAHQDPQSGTLLYSDTRDTSGDDETRRRLFWVAVTLNSWISNEYGRSRVLTRGVSCKVPADGARDFTAELIHLYQISEKLDLEHGNDLATLLDCLNQVQITDVGPDALQLSRVNLTLTIYRRLRVSSPSIPHEALTRIIHAATVGLESAVRLANEHCPWWHVANVPFQVVCTLLAIDSRESLSIVGQAMRSLRKVSQQFQTASMRHAVDAAESLVRLSRRNKQRDLDDLKDGLDDGDLEVSEASQSMHGMTDIPELDWDAFLSADIPLLDSTSLTGT